MLLTHKTKSKNTKHSC